MVITAFFSPSGILHDKLGTYDVAFYLAGIPPIIGGAILFFIPWVHKQEKSQEQARSKDEETMEKMLTIKTTSESNSLEKTMKESESVI